MVQKKALVTTNFQKTCGWISISIGFCLLILIVLNYRTRIEGGRDLGALLIFAIPLLVLGSFAIKLNKWATYILVFFTFVIGIWLVCRSILIVPMPWNLINVSLGFLFLLPGLLLAKQKIFKS